MDRMASVNTEVGEPEYIDLDEVVLVKDKENTFSVKQDRKDERKMAVPKRSKIGSHRFDSDNNSLRHTNPDGQDSESADRMLLSSRKTHAGQSICDFKRDMRETIDNREMRDCTTYGVVSFPEETGKTSVLPFVKLDHKTEDADAFALVTDRNINIVFDVISGSGNSDHYLVSKLVSDLIEVSVNLDAMIITHGHDRIVSKIMG